MSKEKLDFITFLKKEFNVFSYRVDLVDYTQEVDLSFKKDNKSKKDLYSRTKLQKVLDAFIEEAKTGETEFIDNTLIKKWQISTQEQKDEIINTLIKKHKDQSDIFDLSAFVIDKINTKQTSQIGVLIVAFIIFSFLLTSLITVSNPRLIASISNTEQSFFAKIIGVKEVTAKYLVKDVTQEEKINFIKNNQKILRTPTYRDNQTFNIKADEVKGQVAGAYEVNRVLMEKEEGSESLFSRVGELMGRVADKQIELSFKINEKFKNILK